MADGKIFRRGFFGVALLAVSGLSSLALWPTRLDHAPKRALAVFDAVEFEVLVAVAARVLPSHADPIVVAHAVDTMVVSASPDTRADLKRLVRLFENPAAGFLMDGRVKPFTRRTPEDQDATLARWRDSSLVLRRTGYQALRQFCLGAYYADPVSWPLIGYPGPPSFGVAPYDDSMAGSAARPG